jgi:hypothetical protein
MFFMDAFSSVSCAKNILVHVKTAATVTPILTPFAVAFSMPWKSVGVVDTKVFADMLS